MRERTARLLGRMLDATFHAWVRVVAKRVACREAGAQLSSMGVARAPAPSLPLRAAAYALCARKG